MPTPGQTVGPFFGTALPYDGDSSLVPACTPGAISLSGHVYDGAGTPVPDALIEIWQPGPDGQIVSEPGSLHRDGWTFTGWGRAATDRTGLYRFSTLTPGGVNGGAPFFAVTVFARGLLDRLFTRAYLPDRPELDSDPLFAALAPERRDTVLARTSPDGLVFDIRLQGDLETVFFQHNPSRHS